MPTSTDSETTPPESPPEPQLEPTIEPPDQPSPEERKAQIVEGFRAISLAHQNVTDHISAYATWLEKTELTDAAMQLQIELLTSLHNKLQ